ncbi:MAG TPA: hypothetical protein VGQ83_03940 [Polyangia bacterium]|jgi:hypothetical protein
MRALLTPVVVAAVVAGGAARAVAAAPTPATFTLSLPATAPNPSHPEVLVRVPATFAPGGPVNLVVFLHGWSTCVAVVAAAADAPCRPGGKRRPAMDVVAQFDAARVNALLVVPQLAFDAPSSDPGRLGAPGGLRRLVADVLAAPALAPALGARRGLADLGRVVVFAHSGGILPLGRVLLTGGVPVSEAHLLDALYRHHDEIYAWARRHLARFAPDSRSSDRLTFVYTDRERTGPGTRRLLGRIARLLPPARVARTIASHTSLTPPPPALLRVPIVAVRTPLDHDLIPPRLLAPLLAGSPVAVEQGGR